MITNLKKTFNLLISLVSLVGLLAMAATATNGQPIGVKPQSDNARRVSTSDSKLSANPKSSIHPDKDVHDLSKSVGAVVIEGGSYRFVTGSQGKRSYRLKTPYGALEVRG